MKQLFHKGTDGAHYYGEQQDERQNGRIERTMAAIPVHEEITVVNKQVLNEVQV